MIRYPLLGLAAAYALGIVLGDYFSYYPLLTLTLISFFLIADTRFSFFRITLPQYILIILFFWGGFLTCQWSHFYLSENDVSRWINRKVIYTGVIDEAVAHYKDHTTLLLKTGEVEFNGQTSPASGRIKLNINRAMTIPLSYGDPIRVALTLRPPHGFKNKGGFDYGLYLERHGIRATASLTHPEDLTVLNKSRGNLILKKVYDWREKIRLMASRTLKDEPLAIFLALVIGESGYLTNEIRDDFMASGTTHILSISGSHLALVALLTFHFFRLVLTHLPEKILLSLGRYVIPSRLALWFSLPPVLLYGLLAGNQVATNRSMLMIIIFLIGQFLNREQSLLNPLALSALILMIIDPFAIYDISFQLSFGSVLAIAIALERLQQTPPDPVQISSPSKIPFLNQPTFLNWLKSVKSYLWISLATMTGTAPLVAYHFNQFNWVGVIANSVIIPWAGFIIVPIALLTSFSSLIFSSDVLYLGPLNHFLINWFYKTVKFFALFPFAEIHLTSPPLLQLILFFVLILVLLYGRAAPKFRVALLSLALLFPLWWSFGTFRPFKSRELAVTFLDVGQGDSTYIEFPNGQNMIIDGGGVYHEFDLGRLVVAPFLWNQGVHHIDYLVATHPQADHIGGLVYILKKFSIGEVWTNGTTKETRIAAGFDGALTLRSLAPRTVREGEQFKIGDVEVRVLNPGRETTILPAGSRDENNKGIVLKFDYRQRSVLLTADIEKEAEEAILHDHPGLKSTLVKVPHHGGKNSADPDFVKAVAPEIALFSVGLHNPYHHPHPDTLKVYQSLNARIHRTDKEGALVFKTDGDRFEEVTVIEELPEKVPLGKNLLKDELKNLTRIKY